MKKTSPQRYSFLESKAMLDIESAFEEITSQLATKSRISKLWLQYLHYINFLKEIYIDRKNIQLAYALSIDHTYDESFCINRA